MNTKKLVSTLLLSLIALYAITSTGNIIRLVETVHHGWVAWTLGASLGFTLALSSFIAATAKTRKLFVQALIVASLSGIISAIFQTYMYISDGAEWYIASLLGFGIPLIGEVGVALLDAAFTEEHTQLAARSESSVLAQQLESAKNEMAKMAHRHNQKVADLQNQYEQKVAEMAQMLAATTENAPTDDTETATVAHQNSGVDMAENGDPTKNQNGEIGHRATFQTDENGETPQPAKTENDESAKPRRTVKTLAKLNEVVNVVQNGAIANYNDLADATNWSATTARRYWNMAMEDELIRQENGCFVAA